MEILLNIAKYRETNIGFEKEGYDTYRLTFIKSRKPNSLRIVVNGKLSTQEITFNHGTEYKSVILKAVSEFKNGELGQHFTNITKTLTMEEVRNDFGEVKADVLRNHILPIKKEDNRDKLTRYRLI